jgi:hypothetical protein
MRIMSPIIIPFSKIRGKWTLRIPLKRTERRGREVNTPAFLREVPCSNRPVDRLYWLRFYVVFLSSSMRIPGSTINYITSASFQILSNLSFT